MAHPVIFFIVGAIALKLYLGSKAVEKYEEAEIKKTIIDELKAYNFPEEMAEKIAVSASRKIKAGNITIANTTNALNEVFSELKGDLKSFYADISEKTKSFFVSFTDYICGEDVPVGKTGPAQPAPPSQAKSGDAPAPPVAKPDRRDVIIGELVRVKRCTDNLHDDDQHCVCSLIGKIVKISGREGYTQNNEPLYRIADTNKLVVRQEVVLPKKK